MLRTFNMGIGFILIVHPEDWGGTEIEDILRRTARNRLNRVRYSGQG
jgi:phosphoribosylaminoimidazole (AIR) synthetase